MKRTLAKWLAKVPWFAGFLEECMHELYQDWIVPISDANHNLSFIFVPVRKDKDAMEEAAKIIKRLDKGPVVGIRDMAKATVVKPFKA
jgi:hypothetical protein